MKYDQAHKPGINENFLMVRHLRLEGLTEENRHTITEEISQLIGMDAVSITDSENLLNMAYDASTRQLDEIEEIVRKHGCDISHDWWTHFKEGWYRFTDQNAKDNARHDPWSCHKNPPGR